MLDEFGQADILVNAAGAILKKPAVEMTDAEWESILDVNATATLRTCQTFIPRWPPIAGPHHQHRIAEFVRQPEERLRLCRVESGRAGADAEPCRGMGGPA